MKIVLFANTDWYLYNFRRSLALTLRDSGYDVLLISPPGRFGNKLRELGLRWQPLPMNRRSLNPLREAFLLWHLWLLFRQEKPVLVHGFTIKCAVYGGLAARLARVPAQVSAVAGTGYVFCSSSIRAWVLRPVVRRLLRVALNGRRARLILQNSDDVALFERAGLVDASDIRLIRGSGVDCTRFVGLTRDRGPHQPLRVLLAARLLWAKGLAEFVEAARVLHAEGRAIEFFIAGEPDPGSPDAVPESIVRQWQADGVLRWLGHVDDMPGLLASVNVMVLPTTYGEGVPRSLLEGAACALPLIASRVPGCTEVITDGIDGLLIPARNPDALVASIRRLDDDRDLAERLGTAARAKVLQQFDERIVIRQTLAVYDELLAPSHPQAFSPLAARG